MVIGEHLLGPRFLVLNINGVGRDAVDNNSIG